MRRFSDDDSGQLILIACVSIAAALVLIAIYEYSTLGTGEKSINRENMNSYYFYNSIRERYTKLNLSAPDITVFEKEIKDFALLHGYSVDFVCNSGNATVIFVDRDIKIKEDLGVSCT